MLGVIRDEVLKFFPDEPAVVLFHKEWQVSGERPESYIECKKLLFVASVLYRQRNGDFEFNMPEFKQPLIWGFSPKLQTYLGGSVMDATLDEIL